MSTYTRKAYAVEAVKVEQPKFVQTSEGEVYAHRGDWIVTESNGDQHVCGDEIFRLKFELARPPGNQ